MDRNMVDVTSEAALVNKTPTEARDLFNLIAQNTQQFDVRESQTKKVNEIGSNSFVESQLSHIIAMLNKIVTGGVQKAVIYGICCLEGYPTDAFPALQEENINAVYSNQGQMRYIF